MFLFSISTVSTSEAENIAKAENEPIIGNAESVKQTTSDINKYIQNIDTKNIDLTKLSKNQEYAIKPDITTTDNREERDKAEEKKKLAAASRNVVTRNRDTRKSDSTPVDTTTSSSRESNTYAFGYCTWYAAQKRPDLPNRLGNGGNWYNSAQRLGISTGVEARPGAILVTRESWAGHVAYVESVSDSSITVSEMNFMGWDRISTRTIDKNSSIIKGYIY